MSLAGLLFLLAVQLNKGISSLHLFRSKENRFLINSDNYCMLKTLTTVNFSSILSKLSSDLV